MRALVFTAVLLLAACQSEKPPGGGEAGAGGTDAPGGSGGAGEGGTGGAADVLAPTITLTEPADGATFEQPHVLVRGTVHDETGVARLWWTDGAGDRWDLPADGSIEVSFEFRAHLAEGENVLSLEAEDAAGNRATLPVTLELVNPAGLRPTIELFEATRDWVEEGGAAELRWTVTGSRPMQLVIYSTTEYPVLASDAASARVGVGDGDTAAFMLTAVNDFGAAEAYAQVGVGAELRIWPREATVVPGARQALVVRNAASGVSRRWTASGGVVDGEPYGARFRADEPGVYTLTVVTEEAEPRSASTTITVAEVPSSLRGFRGVGGQFCSVNGRPGAEMAVDSQSHLWVPLPGVDGLASWRPEEGGWTFTADAGWSETDAVFPLASGELLAVGRSGMLRLEAGGDTWEAVPAIGEEFERGDRTVGPDGTLYVMTSRYLPEPPALLVLPPAATAFVRLPLPAGIEGAALAFGPAGAVYLAGKDEAELTAVFRRDEADGWIDLGPVPSPAEPIRDLLVAADGRLHLAGRTLARLGDLGWETIGSFPTCAENELCGLFDLALRSDGALLVVERNELYVQQADGTFAILGTSVPAMHSVTKILGALRRVAEGPDGALYLLGDLGVYGLPPGGGAWSVLGAPGIMPGADSYDLLVEPDGSWTLAAGGWGGVEGHFSLYRRAVDGGAWTGFGNEAGSVGQAEAVQHLARDGEGHLFGISMFPFGRAFRIDAETGDVDTLPYDERVRALEAWSESGFGVARDGTVYVAGHASSGRHVYRLRPGDEAWSEDRSFNTVPDFARTPDGVLWAVDGYPVRLASGSWTPVTAGLPDIGAGEDLAVAGDGSLFLADGHSGVFRYDPQAAAWERVGTGEPSLGARRVASNGGRTWALTDGGVFELDAATQAWVPVEAWLPIHPSSVSVFTAAADGTLLVARPEGLGLLQGFDGP